MKDRRSFWIFTSIQLTYLVISFFSGYFAYNGDLDRLSTTDSDTRTTFMVAYYFLIPVLVLPVFIVALMFELSNIVSQKVMIFFAFYAAIGVWVGLPVSSYFDDIVLAYGNMNIGVEDSDSLKDIYLKFPTYKASIWVKSILNLLNFTTYLIWFKGFYAHINGTNAPLETKAKSSDEDEDDDALEDDQSGFDDSFVF